MSETTPSLYETTGLNISLYKPAIVVGTSYAPLGSPVEGDLRDRLSAYMHTISAFGGFDTASFSLAITLSDVDRWLNQIGSHVEVRDQGGMLAWAGFVNSVSVSVGSLLLQRGPLIDTGNRVEIVYSTVDTSTDPPTMGVRVRTAVADDANSQDRYGIIHKVISVGGTTDTDADQIRDTWLAENALPGTIQQYAGGMGGEVVVTVECLGYVHWLKFYPYNQTTLTGTVDLDAKIQAVLGADPNGLFSTDYSYIVSNTLQVKQWEDTDSTAYAVIQALTAMGDAASNRYLFGIYEDQTAHYEQVLAEVGYEQNILQRDQRVRLRGGPYVVPWLVRPGQWLFYNDMNPGREIDLPTREDPRYEFIESVTYTAPYGLQHYGGKILTLPQMLARLGLGGAAS